MRKQYTVLLLLFLILLTSFLVSVSHGTVKVPYRDTVRILLGRVTGAAVDAADGVQSDIILKIRVPRVFLGMIVGASLSIAGLVFQALLRNPLADPYTLGISAGASFGAALSVFLGYVLNAYFQTLLPLFAFAGAIFTVFFVYLLARTRGRVQILTIILSGVIVSYLFSSGLVLIMSLLGDRAHEVIYWLMGSLAGYHRYLLPASLIVSVFILFTFFFFRDLDLMALGDDQAKSLGVNTEFVRILLFSTTSFITAISVSLTGTIGFVGLIIPHSMRLLLGPRHKILIPASVIAGASFLPLSDTLARVLPGLLFQSGMEIPVGVITSVFGSPFFIFLLIRGKKRYWF
jgi:iron complex transport system permease protein